jgi:glycosyltransferase involved in cell wall biosynthesis
MVKQIFFTDELGAGGISTNIVALSSYVASVSTKPIIVALRVRSGGVLDYCHQFSDVISPIKFLLSILKARNEEYVFFINSIRTLLIAYLILFFTVFNKTTIRMIFCVYHPLEFSQKGYLFYFYRKLVLSIGKNNLFFMDGACYQEHAAVCSIESIKPIFLPLVMPKLPTTIERSFNSVRKNVLTVGRFVGFKLHYLRALLQYACARPSIDFYFVGYGEGESELRLFVEQNQLKNVFFLGMVEYCKLQSYYQKANCYVGMGTTLVEASSVGTPSVVAIAGIPGDVCYGLFVRQTDYDMGEFRANKPIHSLASTLDDLLALDQVDFLRVSKQHREFAKQFGFDTVGTLYLKLCKSAGNTRRELNSLVIWLVLVTASVITFFVWKLRGKKSRYDEPYLSNLNSEVS